MTQLVIALTVFVILGMCSIYLLYVLITDKEKEWSIKALAAICFTILVVCIANILYIGTRTYF